MRSWGQRLPSEDWGWPYWEDYRVSDSRVALLTRFELMATPAQREADVARIMAEIAPPITVIETVGGDPREYGVLA